MCLFPSFETRFALLRMRTEQRPRNKGRQASWTPAPAAITRSTPAACAIRKASGARRRRRSTGSSSPRRSSTRRPASMAAGSSMASATPATTRSTATCTPAAATRPRSSTTAPSPARRRAITYAELLTEVAALAGVLRDLGVDQGRPRHHLHADGAGGGDRHAGLRADRRGPFGGVRRLRRQGARDPHRRLPSRR